MSNFTIQKINSSIPDPLIPTDHPAAKFLTPTGAVQEMYVHINLYEVEPVKACRVQLTAGNAKSILNMRFPNQNNIGLLDKELSSVPEETVLDPRLTYAICSSVAIEDSDAHYDINNEHAQLGIMAQSMTRCAYSPSDITHLNVEHNDPEYYASGHGKFSLTGSINQQMGQEQAQIYIGDKRINPNQSIYEIGSDHGFFIQELQSSGFKNITGVDPYKNENQHEAEHYSKEHQEPISSAMQAALDAIKCTTAEEDIKLNKNKVDVVVINNINPSASSMDSMVKAGAQKAKKGSGTILVSVSGGDPQRTAKNSEVWTSLKKHFRKVNFVPVDQTKVGAETKRYGNMIGYYVASKTIR